MVVGKSEQRRAAVFIVSLGLAAVFAVVLAGWDGPASHAATPPLYSPGVTGGKPSMRFPAYYGEWSANDHDYVVADIPASMLTDINYAFIKPDDVDGDGLYECTELDRWAAEREPM